MLISAALIVICPQTRNMKLCLLKKTKLYVDETLVWDVAEGLKL